MIHKLKVTPLGGVGEIGAINCMVYETDNAAILVDCGSMFPDQETLGVDLIIPDFTYLREIKDKLKAIVFTHGHEDHIGAVPFLTQEFCLPIFAAPFTMGLIEKKLEEYPLKKKPRLHVFQPGDPLSIGDFNIQTAFVNHSIIDASALALQTKHGLIVHLTDWKIDKTPVSGPVIDSKKFEAWGKSGVLALFSDSTNVDCLGKTLSEKEVARELLKIASSHSGRLLITLFSSNIQRVQALVNLAKRLNRVVSFVGRSMKENVKIARVLGKLNTDGADIRDVEETRDLAPERVMVLATGAQGEARSVLSRMAMNEFKPFRIQEGDLVLFSSKRIPGNEKNIYAMINHLCKHGAKVIAESQLNIHTSGHAHQDELKWAVKTLRPKNFIPIHGEFRHLRHHAELASDWGVKNIFVIENGQTLHVGAEVVVQGEVPTGRVFVDGLGVGDVNDLVLRDRRQLAETGIVICVLMIHRTKGEILRGPELISRGFTDEENAILEKAKGVVTQCLEGINFETRTDTTEVQEEVRVALRRFFRKEINRKPVVIPVIQEV